MFWLSVSGSISVSTPGCVVWCLQTICAIGSPILWSNVYALGVRGGNDGVFYYVVSAMAAAQLLLSRMLPADLDQ